jgi:hypothetical protein
VGSSRRKSIQWQRSWRSFRRFISLAMIGRVPYCATVPDKVNFQVEVPLGAKGTQDEFYPALLATCAVGAVCPRQELDSQRFCGRWFRKAPGSARGRTKKRRMLPTNPRVKVIRSHCGGIGSMDLDGCGRRVELAESLMLPVPGVFLGCELVTTLTDVMACLQTWALKTGLLSFIRADTRGRGAYMKVSMPHTRRRQERGRA